MSKLSLNLTKISKNQPKLAIERFFFVGKKNGLVRRAGEEKRMDSNNIHLRTKNNQFQECLSYQGFPSIMRVLL